MFIYNLKINGNKFAKILFSIMIIIIFFILCFGVYNIFLKEKISENSVINVSYTIKPDEIFEINSANYTNILKAANENIDNYVGCKVHLTGYVYRLIDFTPNQFVVARDMIISNDKQCLIVGFLSEYNNANEFKDGAWVDVTGIIKKGNFNGDIAILNVLEIKEIQKPSDEFVYPPDDTYIPTSSMF